MKTAPYAEPARIPTWRGALAGVVLAGGGMALAPTVHAVDTAANEGDKMEFTIKLGAAPNGWAMRYKYSTKNDSAVAGDDYQSSSGKVTFSSGEKEKKVSVNTIDDNADEGAEVFKLKLYDQEVNGLYLGVTGWTASTIVITGMPMTMRLTGQIMDNDSSTAGAKAASNAGN